ncbi:hypothetical protein [Roseixanthobacter glucoisosaccharinicivorans]|uniref:hypothetical protein n=1 Tax=Roseixanthobacter glucoisosaccharinicivorans TaxID=3119923 RepID=UPI00372817E4
MLSPDRAALLARLGLVCALSGALAGCFQPMYAANSTVAGPALQERLQDIEIVKINGRIGNDLRNDLIYNLTGGAGNPANAPYKMFITVRSSSSFAIVDTQSGLPEAKTFRVEGEWKLVRAGEETKPPIASGKAAAAVSTDVSEQRFANYSAARDAESRASQVVADQIKVQLAAFFIKNPTGTPAPGGPPTGSPPVAPPPAAAPATPAAAPATTPAR